MDKLSSSLKKKILIYLDLNELIKCKFINREFNLIVKEFLEIDKLIIQNERERSTNSRFYLTNELINEIYSLNNLLNLNLFKLNSLSINLFVNLKKLFISNYHLKDCNLIDYINELNCYLKQLIHLELKLTNLNRITKLKSSTIEILNIEIDTLINDFKIELDFINLNCFKTNKNLNCFIFNRPETIKRIDLIKYDKNLIDFNNLEILYIINGNTIDIDHIFYLNNDYLIDKNLIVDKDLVDNNLIEDNLIDKNSAADKDLIDKKLIDKNSKIQSDNNSVKDNSINNRLNNDLLNRFSYLNELHCKKINYHNLNRLIKRKSKLIKFYLLGFRIDNQLECSEMFDDNLLGKGTFEITLKDNYDKLDKSIVWKLSIQYDELIKQFNNNLPINLIKVKLLNINKISLNDNLRLQLESNQFLNFLKKCSKTLSYLNLNSIKFNQQFYDDLHCYCGYLKYLSLSNINQINYQFIINHIYIKYFLIDQTLSPNLIFDLFKNLNNLNQIKFEFKNDKLQIRRNEDVLFLDITITLSNNKINRSFYNLFKLINYIRRFMG